MSRLNYVLGKHSVMSDCPDFTYPQNPKESVLFINVTHLILICTYHNR